MLRRIKNILLSEEGPDVVAYLLMHAVVMFWAALSVAIFVDAILLDGRYA